jgi:DNA-binding GntR family transcriptional regulator
MKHDERPEHQKIAAEYRAQIMSGELPPGSQLPTVVQLMERHGVAVHTIQKMLNVLKGEGLTETRRGIGVFVRKRSLVATVATEYLALPNRLLDIAEVKAPADVATVFSLNEGARCSDAQSSPASRLRTIRTGNLVLSIGDRARDSADGSGEDPWWRCRTA